MPTNGAVAGRGRANPTEARLDHVRRLASLDVLRAVAVLLVIVHHAKMPPGAHEASAWPTWAEPLVHAARRGGWIGVDLFFVLSGFLVSGLLFREYRSTGEVRIGRFLVRRGFKIYPAFYVMVGAFIAWNAIGQGSAGVEWRSVVSEMLFVQNYGPAAFDHSWSLAVEEHFYLLCGLGIAWLARRHRGDAGAFRSVPWIFAAVAVGCLGARIATTVAWPAFEYKVHYMPTHLRLDGLMFGVFLSYVYWFRRDVLERIVGRWRALLAVLAFALFAPAFLSPLTATYHRTLGFTALYLGAGALLLVMVLRPPSDTLVVRALAYIGRHSYSIYLWHVAVLWRLWRVLDVERPEEPGPLMLGIAVSIAAGVAMAKLVENPVLKLRDRVLPAAARGRAAAIPAQEAAA